MGDKLDGRSDIFSLGVCAFEMLSGEQPFPGTNVTSILYKLVHVDPVEPENLEMNGLVPQKWHEVFGKVLAKRPDDRYQTATDFVQDLEYCLGAWFGGLPEDLLRPAPIAAGAEAAPNAPTGRSGIIHPRRTDDSTASLPMIPPFPPGAPPVSPDAAPTDTLPPGTPEPQAVPATIVLSAPVLAASPTGATVVMGASPQPHGSPTDATFKSVPPAPTVRAPMPAPDVTEKVPRAVAAAAVTPAAAPLEPTRRAPAPAAVPSPARPPARPRAREGPRVSAGVILAFAGVLTVAAVGLGMAALYRRLVTPKAAAPEAAEPAAAAAPQTAQAPAPAPVAPVAAPAVGTLRVTSKPPGAAVTIDGRPIGLTPMEVPGLPLGDHDVKLALKGYEPRSEKVTLTAEAAHAELSLPLARVAPTAGQADVLSVPSGAVVTVDGAAVGYTPLMSWKLKPGIHKVEVTKDGHEPWSGSVTVAPGKRIRVDAELKPHAPVPLPTMEAVDPARVYEVAEVDARPNKLGGEWAAAPKLRSGERISVGGSFVVNEKGEVTDLRITESGGKALDESVAAAIRKWKYAPATRRGVKVKVRLPFRQTFTTG
jgi:TonB family protein